MTMPSWNGTNKSSPIPKDFVRFREGHLYRLRNQLLVAIYDTYREREISLRMGQGIVIQGNSGCPVGTHLYPIEPYEVVREEYPLTDQDRSNLFNRGYEIGVLETEERAGTETEERAGT